MIRTRDGHLYTGIATDVDRRLDEHAGSGGRGAKYLRGRGPLSIEFRVRIGDQALAQQVEYRVKRLSRADKQQLVDAAPDPAGLLEMLGLI